MSWGLQQYGIGSWGGSDFIVTDHFPSDSSIGVPRLSTISFTLLSQTGNVINSSINLTANGTPLITNGLFTAYATGTIDSSNSLAVHVVATVTHAFAPLAAVTIVVNATNSSAQFPVLGTTWSFTTDNNTQTFTNYIVRGFERVFKVNS